MVGAPASSSIASQVRVLFHPGCIDMDSLVRISSYQAITQLVSVLPFIHQTRTRSRRTHDELDIEFLGNTKGEPWRIQTNLYGNGSTGHGREERYRLWFDPSKEFHRYSILWTAKNIIFYIDDVPIREVIRNEEMGSEYPSKPMSLYATIWDASSWATSGGKYKVNYKFAPFVSEFKDFVLEGCSSDPIEEFPSFDCYETDARLENADYATITPRQRSAMRRFRQRYMYYSYCYDALRYPVPLPECVMIPSEKERFRDTGRLKFGGSHQGGRRRSRRRGRGRVQASTSEYDPDM
ncbi:hypothetical protein OIU77_027369 [Salix suchowensis]|uniref:Xyloglucan endotransglucosylase/hydrolase n=1 Tax=Salix suchowensis TaxID=1278906 RepID=A0ABQ9BSM8_9ROSI|nr:hypothetical protein OIU77_027369 [Salix suchowensis]